ncbi:hypothetical protein WKW77_24515 [Variovorax ureilyticus]|uniref:Helix-turn-helix domain-containing protein n=1 Tax=Variovorax ureilyticus TaxID=1836198 RepID=A0ABU8VLA7_9BURK
MTKEIYGTAAETKALLRDGQTYRLERLRAEDMITVDEAASLMRVNASVIEGWIRNCRCIGLAGPHGAMVVPQWQFESSLWSSIRRIGQSLGTQDPWQILGFLETSAPALDGLTPRAALEQGVPIGRVLNVAVADTH